MYKYLGKLAIIVSILMTFVLWIWSKPDPGLILEYPLISLAQICGLTAAVLLGYQYLLATRLIILEKFFGGLDKIYQLHHMIGGIAFVLMLLHPLLQILENIKYPQLIRFYVLPSDQLPYTLGVLALYGFIVLIFLTLYLRLPYNTWRKTHIFIGIPLILVSLHIALMPSDTTNFLPLRLWMMAFTGMAIMSAILKRFFYNRFSPHFVYEISDVKQQNSIWKLQLKPRSKKITFKPGQFAFLQINSAGVPNDKHPFSMTSAPEDPNLSFGIKQEGLFTSAFPNLDVGDEVSVYGPHGEFYDKYLSTSKDLIFIAGGIGITPFLSILRNEQLTKGSRKIWLYYCVSNEEEAVFDAEIKEMSKDLNNLVYKKWVSAVQGRCTAEAVLSDDGKIDNKAVMICGPSRMMIDLNKQFLAKGFKPFNIVYEDFSLLP